MKGEYILIYFENEDTDKFIYKLIKTHKIGSTLEVVYKKQSKETKVITKHNKRIKLNDQYIEFFVRKDRTNKKREYLPHLNTLEKITCKFKDLYETMMDLANYDSYDSRRKTIKYGEYPAKKKIMKDLHFNPIFFGSDLDIIQHYNNMFSKELINDDSANLPISVAHCDTEVYSPLYETFPDQNLAPVPILTTQIYIPSQKKCFINVNLDAYRLAKGWNDIEAKILAKDPETIAYYYIETNRKWLQNKGIINEIDTLTYVDGVMYSNDVIIPKNDLRVIDIEFKLLNDELHTICHFFNDIRKNDIDLVYFWNMNFDIITIQNRLKKLLNNNKRSDFEIENLIGSIFSGVDRLPQSDRKFLKVQYRFDKSKFDFKVKNDKVYFQGDYWIMDLAMIFAKTTAYAGTQSYKLDDVLKKYVNESKISYDSDISGFMTGEVKKFLLYSIVDTVGMESIDKKLELTSSLVGMCEMSASPLIMERHPTVILTNYIKKILEQDGRTVCNNLNRLFPPVEDTDIGDGETKKQFKGALVANILNNFDDGINGTYRLFGLSYDFDLTALYPTIMKILNYSLDNFAGTLKLVNGQKSYHILNKKICGIESFFFNILKMPNVKFYLDKLDSVETNVDFDIEKEVKDFATYRTYIEEIAKSIMIFKSDLSFNDAKAFVYKVSKDPWERTLVSSIVQIHKSDDKNNINPEDLSVKDLLELVFNEDKSKRKILAGSGGLFDKTELSPLVEIITNLLTERKRIKGEMFACINSDPERAEVLNMKQTNIKRLVNSLYGAMAQAYFLFFNLNAVQSITLTGHFPTLVGIWGFESTFTNNFDISSIDKLISMITLSLKKCPKAKLDLFYKLYGDRRDFFTLDRLMSTMKERCDIEFFKNEYDSIKDILLKIDSSYYPILSMMGKYTEFLGISTRYPEYNDIFKYNKKEFTNLCRLTYKQGESPKNTSEFRNISKLLCTYVMPNYIYDDIHEFYNTAQKKVVRYSDTDSALLTITKDYLDAIKNVLFNEIDDAVDYKVFKDLVVDLNIDINSVISARLMDMLSEKLDCRKEHMKALEFKSEFKFSLLYLFNAKNYINHIVKKEGKIIDKIDYKGLPVIKSNMNTELSSLIVELIDQILVYDYYKNDKINVSEFMYKFSKIIDTVLESIRSGQTHLIPNSLKYSYGSVESYMKINKKPVPPGGMQRGIYGTMLWDFINPDNMIQQGNRFLYLPIILRFDDDKELISILSKYDIKLSDKQINDLMKISIPKGKKDNHLLKHIAIPYGSKIPAIVGDYLNDEEIVKSIVSPMTSIIEALGVDYDTFGGFTNVTKI